MANCFLEQSLEFPSFSLKKYVYKQIYAKQLEQLIDLLAKIGFEYINGRIPKSFFVM